MASKAKEKVPCHISDRLDKKPDNEVGKWSNDVYRRQIQDSVCRKLETFEHTDGKHYCLLHLPTTEKDVEEFNSIVRTRMDEIAKCAPEPETMTEEQLREAMRGLSYDFRYVWFPASFDFSSHDFRTFLYFGHSVFIGSADFIASKFYRSANFDNVRFETTAAFNGAHFKEGAYFSSCSFGGVASFSEAIFEGVALFEATVFKDRSYFPKAVFNNWADFHASTHLGDVHFDNVFFNFELRFLGSAFGTPEKPVEINYTGTSFAFLSGLDSAEGKKQNDKETVNFKEAKFHGRTKFDSTSFFANADFSKAKFFGDLYFTAPDPPADSEQVTSSDKRAVIFNGDIRFKWVEFHGNAYFEGVEFKSFCSFNSALFGKSSDVFFRNGTTFDGKLSLSFATLAGYLTFNAENNDEEMFQPDSRLFMQYARLERPEGVLFHSVKLMPNWFINTDPGKFTFANTEWRCDKLNPQKAAQDEVDYVNVKEKEEKILRESHNAIQPLDLLPTAYRHLSQNSENNSRFSEASRFRQMAFECERLGRIEKQREWRSEGIFCKDFFTSLSRKLKDWPYDSLSFLYRWLSGYGENWKRAACLILLLWAFSALIYWLFGQFQGGATLGLQDSFEYSLQIMTLQKPDPRPSGGFTSALTLFQTIAAPLQAALLALAIRRRFMR